MHFQELLMGIKALAISESKEVESIILELIYG